MIFYTTNAIHHCTLKEDVMKINIVHTSRGRPQIAYDTVYNTLANRESDHAFLYTLGIEENEWPLYESVIRMLQETFNIPNQPTLFTYTTFSGARIELSDILTADSKWKYDFKFPLDMENYLTANTKGNILYRNAAANCDWIVTIADNFYQPKGWDTLMLPTLLAHRGQVAILGYVNQLWRQLVSHPVITPAFLRWNDNELMSSKYFHTHGDCELFLKGKLAEVLYAFDDKLQPSRKHASDGTASWDELCCIDNSFLSLGQAEAVWQIRKAAIIKRFT